QFDSADIVQSALVDVWDGLRHGKWTFRHADQFKAFLIKATRNRLVDHFRQSAPKLAHERSLLEADSIATDSHGFNSALEVASAKELWERILATCPGNRREIVRLKGQGLSSAEIAS